MDQESVFPGSDWQEPLGFSLLFAVRAVTLSVESMGNFPQPFLSRVTTEDALAISCILQCSFESLTLSIKFVIGSRATFFSDGGEDIWKSY